MTENRKNLPLRNATYHRDRVDNPVVPDGTIGRLPDRSVERATFTTETIITTLRELGTGRHITTWFFPGNVFQEAGRARHYFEVAATILSCYTAVTTAPTGASIIVDLEKNGTTTFTTQANRPTIAVSGFVSGFAVPDVTGIAAGEYVLPHIDQVGSTIPGGDLVVHMRWEEA